MQHKNGLPGAGTPPPTSTDLRGGPRIDSGINPSWPVSPTTASVWRVYFAYELSRRLAAPLHGWASAWRTGWSNPANPLSALPVARTFAATAELLERVTAPYPKPEFGLE